MSIAGVRKRTAAMCAGALMALALPIGAAAQVTAHTLQVTPETATNTAGSTHTLTATVDTGTVVAAALNIDFEIEEGPGDPDVVASPMTPDLTCTIQIGQSSCTVSYTGAGPGNNTIRAWIDADGSDATTEADMNEGRVADNTTDCGNTLPAPGDCIGIPMPGDKAEPDDTDVVAKTWTDASAPDSVTISPESDTAQANTCNAFTIEVKAGDAPAPGIVIDVEQNRTSGTGAVSFCTPSSGPNATNVDPTKGDLTEQPDDPHTIGGETTSPTDANGQVTIGVFTSPGNGSDGSGNVTVKAFYDPNDNDDDDLTEPKDTATKTWTAAPPVQPPRSIDCDPETSTKEVTEAQTISCLVLASDATAVPGAEVSFVVSGVGTVTPLQTTSNEGGRAIATASSSNKGTQTITAELNDKSECTKPGGDPPGSFPGTCSDQISITWQDSTPGAPAVVRLKPKERTSGIGNRVTVKATVFDAEGNAVPGASLGWIEFGVGGIISADNRTNDNGVAKAVVRSNEPGNQQIFANLPTCPENNTDCRKSVLQHWGPKRCDVFLSNFDDVYEGTRKDEVICGFGGNDRIKGGGGNDVLIGAGGNDRLFGGKGKDTIKGGQGNDNMNGGPGKDTCKGGGGRNRSKSC